MSIQLAVPAAFGEVKAENRTSKYNFVSTENIMGIFQEQGWLPAKTSQVNSRIPGYQDYAKHLITFQNPDVSRINGIVPQINLINSHNGSSSFRLMAGLFRFVCENGLIVAESEFSSVRIRHSSQAPLKIQEAIIEIVEIVPQITAKAEEMQTIILSPVAQMNLSNNVIEQIWEDPKVRPFEPIQLLETRRQEDKERSLWNTYNTIQENLIKGGLIGTTTTNRKRKMKGITNIDRNVKVNQILWQETDNFLKAA